MRLVRSWRNSTKNGIDSLYPNDCNMVYVGELSLFAFGTPTEIYAGPNDPPTIPGFPAYLNGEDVTDVIPLYFSVDQDGMFTDDDGWLTTPLAAVNCSDCQVIPAEDSTWSGIKELYR